MVHYLDAYAEQRHHPREDPLFNRLASRSPEAVRNEDMDELVKVFVAAGQRKLGSSMIEADFRDGVRQGLRVRMDNRDDVVFNDSYAWRRADGDVLLVTFSYKSQERDQALRFIPTIAQSLQ